jgi:hypothetical protein
VGGIRKQIDAAKIGQAVARIVQRARVARERCDITRDVNDA